MEELRQAAEKLSKMADILSRTIESTNALFQRMFEYAQRTDAKYALKIQGIKNQINAYINKIEALRDSFDPFTGIMDWGILDKFSSDNKSNLFAYTKMLAPSTPNARLDLLARAINAGLVTLEANSSALTNPQWTDIRSVLAQPLTGSTRATDADFANLATIFGRLGQYVGDLEKFLNLMMVPIPNVGLVHVMHSEFASSRFPPGSEIVAFRICPDRSSRLAFHLNHQIASAVTTQLEWRANGFNHSSLDDSRQNMQRNFELLSSITRLNDENHVVIGAGDSPLRIRELPDGRIRTTFHYGLYMGFTNPSTVHPYAGITGFLRIRTITISPSREVLDHDLQRIATTRFQLNHQFNMLSHVTGQGASLALGAIPVYGTAISAGGAILGTVNSRRNATGVISNHELTINYWSLANYHRDFALEGIVITDSSGGIGGATRDTRVQTWLTALTPESLRALELVSGIEISWEELLQDSRIGLYVYLGLDAHQRNQLWLEARNNWGAAHSDIPPPAQTQAPPAQRPPATNPPAQYHP